jgi:hypothetical protein
MRYSNRCSYNRRRETTRARTWRVPVNVRLVRSTSAPPFDRLDDELLAIDPERQLCFSMNGTASEVWEMLAEPQTVAGLCQSLLLRYEVDPDECERDVTVLVDKLRTAGLVVETSPPNE